VTVAMPPFRKFLRGHVRTVPGNVHIKFEARSFNRFGAIRFNAQTGLIDWSAVHRHTHRHTSNENSISAIHSVHLAENIIFRAVELTR